MKAVVFFLFQALLLHAGAEGQVWIAPRKYSWQSGEKQFATIMKGPGFEASAWIGGKDSLLSLGAFSNNYSYDLLGFLGRTPGDSVRLDTLSYAGNFTIAGQGTNGMKKLPAAIFREQVGAAGMSAVLQLRSDSHEDTIPALVFTRWNAQALVRVKSTLRKSDFLKNSFFATQTGLKLEIVPLDNPFNLEAAGKIAFNVYYQGRLLKDGIARIWHRKNGATIVNTLAVVKGLIEPDLTATGSWMIEITRFEALKVNGGDAWQQTTGTITWGFE